MWLHEIKLDGFRVIARKDGARVRFYSRPGNDLTKRFPVVEDAMLARASPRIQLNEHIEEDGALVFDHACRLGFEGIVSKRMGSPCSSGRSPHWLKSKNPESAAVRREMEEDWGR